MNEHLKTLISKTQSIAYNFSEAIITSDTKQKQDDHERVRMHKNLNEWKSVALYAHLNISENDLYDIPMLKLFIETLDSASYVMWRLSTKFPEEVEDNLFEVKRTYLENVDEFAFLKTLINNEISYVNERLLDAEV